MPIFNLLFQILHNSLIIRANVFMEIVLYIPYKQKMPEVQIMVKGKVNKQTENVNEYIEM